MVAARAMVAGSSSLRLASSPARLLASRAGSRQLCHVHTAPCQAGAPTGLLRALVSVSRMQGCGQTGGQHPQD